MPEVIYKIVRIIYEENLINFIIGLTFFGLLEDNSLCEEYLLIVSGREGTENFLPGNSKLTAFVLSVLKEIFGELYLTSK